MSQDIYEKIKSIVIEQLGVESDKVTTSARFVELGADSLDSVEMIMAFEEAFDIEIPDEEAEKITTIDEAVQYISAASEG